MSSFISNPVCKQKSPWVKADDDVCDRLPEAQLTEKLSEEKHKKVFTTNYRYWWKIRRKAPLMRQRQVKTGNRSWVLGQLPLSHTPLLYFEGQSIRTSKVKESILFQGSHISQFSIPHLFSKIISHWSGETFYNFNNLSHWGTLLWLHVPCISTHWKWDDSQGNLTSQTL